jgi:WD40 repeat protein
MAKIDDVHHEDINSLNFSKKDPQRFIAGSDDGIVCSYDLTQKSIDDVNCVSTGRR